MNAYYQYKNSKRIIIIKIENEPAYSLKFILKKYIPY